MPPDARPLAFLRLLAKLVPAAFRCADVVLGGWIRTTHGGVKVRCSTVVQARRGPRG